MKKFLQNKEIFGGLFFFCFASITFWLTSQIQVPPIKFQGIGPRQVPYFLSTLILLLSIRLIWNGCKRVRQGDTSQNFGILPRETMIKISMFSALLIATIILLKFLGFFPALFIFLMISPLILDYTNPIGIIAIAVVTTALLYGVFDVALGVVFPTGTLIELLNL